MKNTKTIANYTYTTRANGHIVPSPCVAVCTMSLAGGLCEGCLRTLDEIAQWSQMDNAGKERVWVDIEKRRLAARATAASGNRP